MAQIRGLYNDPKKSNDSSKIQIFTFHYFFNNEKQVYYESTTHHFGC
jgi:hypothetical protein